MKVYVSVIRLIDSANIGLVQPRASADMHGFSCSHLF